MRKPGVRSWVAGWAMAAAVGLLLAGSGAAAQFGDVVGAIFTDIDGNFPLERRRLRRAGDRRGGSHEPAFAAARRRMVRKRRACRCLLTTS